LAWFLGLHAFPLARFQELGELHGRARPSLQLPVNGPLVLPQYVPTPAALQLAVFQIQENVYFPRLKRIARNGSAHHFAHEPLKPVEHQFQLNWIVRRHSGE
jgi:hypothetical protein